MHSTQTVWQGEGNSALRTRAEKKDYQDETEALENRC